MRLLARRAAAALFVTLIAGIAHAQPSLPPEIALGKSWLIQQVETDGRLRESAQRLATEPQSEAEVIETLVYLSSPVAALTARHRNRALDAGVEHLARRMIALARSGQSTQLLLNELRALQNADGGFGGANAHASTVLDTSLALIALRAAGVAEGNDIGRALDYLAARVNTPAHVDWVMATSAKPYVSAYVLYALQTHSARFPIAATISAQREALIAQQGNGIYVEVLLDTVAALALQFSSTGETGLTALKDSIRAAQLADGSWQGDAFLTALALRALSVGVVTPPTTDGRVLLRVRDGVTLNYLAGVTLSAVEFPAFSALSGADGKIDSGALPASSYTLSIVKEGYQSRSLGTVSLSAGQTRDLGVFDLSRDANTAVLFGRVTDVSTTNPLAGVEIAVTGAATQAATTGPDGTFELSFSVAGPIQVQASRSGYQTVTGSGTLVLGQALRFSPALYPDGNQVPSDATLTAMIVNAQSEAPIPGATLMIGSASADADAGGRVRLDNLPIGAFTGQVSKPGYLGANLSGTLVAGGNDAGVIRLMPENNLSTSTLSGRVLDADNGSPLAGATVAISGSNLRAVADANGAYRIENIAAVPFTATATAAGYGTRQVSTDSTVHANFNADIQLNKLISSNLNVSLEGLTMSAPEYDPFTEVGVLGTVRNTGTQQEIGLIFNAVVSDASGAVVRDVPHIRVTLAHTFADTIVPFAPGEAKAITIIWGNLNDAPGDYNVLFRGVTADGQIAVEGVTSYRVRAVRRLGGGITLDPPIVQAGTGQSVAIEADLTNMGNQVIPAGDVRMQITMVAKDDRPPLPPKPTFGAHLLSGAPLNRPIGITRDGLDNTYTVNNTGLQLVRVAADGSATVVRTMPTTSNTGVAMSSPIWIGWHQPNLIRAVTQTGWQYEVDLDNGNSIVNHRAPPAGLTSATAYAPDLGAGLEYFGGAHSGRQRVIRRDTNNQVSVIVDAGMNDTRSTTVGPDGNLYVANYSPGAVFKVNPSQRSIEPFWTGLGQPTALVFDAGGTLYAAEVSPQRIMRRFADGRVEVFATGLGVNINDLKFGIDGALYALASNGSLRKFAADGSNTVAAQGILNNVNLVGMDRFGGFGVQYSNSMRYRAADGSVQAINVGSATATDFVAADLPGEFFITPNAGGLQKVSSATPQTLLPTTAGVFNSIARDADNLLLLGSRGSRSALFLNDRGSGLSTVAVSPFSNNVLKIRSLPNGGTLVINNDSLVRIDGNGVASDIVTVSGPSGSAISRDQSALWLNASEGLLRIDLTSGVKTRLRASISAMQYDMFEDASGGLVYSDYSARKIVRYDLATGLSSDVAVPPTGYYPTGTTFAGNGDLVIRVHDNSLRRYDGSNWTQIDTSVTELTVAADGRSGYRKSANFYEIAATPGTAPRLLAVMVSAPALSTWIDDDRFVDYSNATALLQTFNAAGSRTALLVGFHTVTNIAVTTAGEYFLLNSSGYLSKYVQGQMQRVGRYSGALRIIADGNELLLTTSAGVSRLAADSTLASVLTVPGWTAGQYRSFSRAGDQTVLANSVNHEIVLIDAGAVAARYAPFNSPTAFAQYPDGSWLIANAERILRLDPATGQTQPYSAQTGTRDLGLLADGRALSVRADLGVYVHAADGIAKPFSGILNETNTQMVAVAIDAQAGATYAVSAGGSTYRDDEGALRYLIAGVNSVSALHLLGNGDLMIGSSASSTLFAYRSTGLTPVGALLDGVQSICSLDDDTLAIGGSSYLSIFETAGSANFAAYPSTMTNRGISCLGDGELLLTNNSPSQIWRASAGVQQASVQVGDVVREQVVSIAELGLDGGEQLSFNDWLPPEGGDYEVSIVPVEATVEGSLLAGIHVGPAAKAQMSVTPNSVAPGEASVQINTRLEGADFTRLAKINRALIQVISSGVYPTAMSMDPQGQLWYQVGSLLYRKPLGNSTPVRVGTFSMIAIRGELPIDSLGRAYVVASNSGYEIRRIDSTGAWVRLAHVGASNVVSMTIDNQDRIYAVTGDNRVHLIQPDGTRTEYAVLPAGATPFGISRDGAGGLYVQQYSNRIVYISPDREIKMMDLRGASFEYEGVNIAGDCAEGLFLTPISLPGTGQTGEEHTVVQLVGRTGEIGTILNGRVINSDLLDIDFITYDRFGSRLLMMGDVGGYNLYSMPVTCGAIDLDLHIVLPGNQPLQSAEPAPSTQFVHQNGDIEYVWTLRDVNKQGVTIALYSRLFDLVRLEDRPAVKEAFVMLKNSFQPAPVRVDIEVPTVHVRDMVDIAVELDREEYPQQTPVGIRVPMNNLDNVTKSGYLIVRVEDAAGALVEVLVERLQTFDALESIELNPPYNTGVLRAGDYRVVAEIKDELGGVVAAGFDTFRVIAGNGSGPTLSSAVTTDKPIYTVGENAMILASVRNLSANLGFENLIVSERVSDANGQLIYDGSLPQANLEPGAEARLTYRVSLSGAAPGFYDVLQQVRSQSGELLDQQSARFEVQSIGGITALTGTLAVDPLRIRRGAPEAILGTLRNRGQSDMAGIESILRVIHPGTGASLASWNGVHDLAAGASVDLPQNFATAGLALRDYLVVLSARVGGVERVLAQKPFHVQDVVFEGDIDASPAVMRQGVDVNLTGAVRNVGNFPADASVVHLRVFGEISQALIREWQYPTNIAAGSAFNVGQLLNTLPLAIGDYRVRLSVSFEGNELVLDDDLFTVGNYRIAGTFDANPGEVERGDPVDLIGMVSNSGNFDIDQLPLRIEVLKLDTQVSMFILEDSTALAAGASYTMPRVADSATLAPGEYIGVFSAYFDGAWQVMATDNFRVINPIDVSLEMNVPRDARVLVLLSCSQHQAQQTGVSGGHAQTVCEQQRQTFLSQYLSERGIEHRIVLDQASFMTELRCGRYNVFWFAGGAVKLGVAEAIEVRESIYRGDGFIVEGDNDQRNSQFDEMLGLNFRGHHSGSDLPVTGSASLFPEVTRPSYGRMLKLELTTGRIEARFATVNWPAIVGSSYGSGRALSYGFDLIEVLRRDGTDPASERLMMNGLMHVAPIATPADYATGAYVPVTTTVFNRGAGFDARLETEVDAPTVIASSAPTATSGDAARSAWNFALTPGDERSFDVNLIVGNVSPVDVRSRLFERDGDRLAPVGNAQIALDVRDAAAATSALLDGLRSASLHGGENAARNRAISAIESARTFSAQGNISAAIGKWLDASDEVRRITSVSHSAWRLAIARLLAVTQHLGCDAAIKLCGTSPAAPVAFDSMVFQPLSILGKAQAGGAADWEWQLAGRGDAEPLLRLNLDWQKNRAVDFKLSINAQGQGSLQLRQDNVLKGTLSSDLTRDGRLMLADALSFTARNSSDVGNAKVTLNNLVLNGQALNQTLSSSTNGAFAETRLSLFKPNVGATLELTGRIEMGFSGNSLPGGSRLELQIDSGRLQCNGGAQ